MLSLSKQINRNKIHTNVHLLINKFSKSSCLLPLVIRLFQEPECVLRRQGDLTYSIPMRPDSEARNRWPWNRSYRVKETFNPTLGPLYSIRRNKNSKYEFTSCSLPSPIRWQYQNLWDKTTIMFKISFDLCHKVMAIWNSCELTVAFSWSFDVRNLTRTSKFNH